MKAERYKMIFKLKKDKNEIYFIGKNFVEKEKEEGLRILGEDFVKNNKNKGKLVINNKKSNLRELIPFNDINNNKLKIKIILDKDIYNLNHMFKDCISLLNFSPCCDDIYSEEKEENKFNGLIEQEQENQNNLIDYFANTDNNDEYLYQNLGGNTDINMSEISENINKDSGLSTISYLNNKLQDYQNNYAILSGMFYNCFLLRTLTDIFKLNIIIIDMNRMF